MILSAPAEDKSGTGSSTATPAVLAEPCEFDTCPAGSPAVGYDASDGARALFSLKGRYLTARYIRSDPHQHASIT